MNFSPRVAIRQTGYLSMVMDLQRHEHRASRSLAKQAGPVQHTIPGDNDGRLCCEVPCDTLLEVPCR